MRSCALLALFASTAVPVAAQVPLQTAPGAMPDADQLAAAMRRVGDNPRDLAALLTAGELSLRLGDASGAASLFKRAEAIDPMNGRVKAGMARILVTQERPGEALRYFDQAIGYGLDPRSFAGDRALAYDLLGEQERAQRDYRLALRTADNDEVRRRYALSLGISGRRELALEQIEPLVRRNDRGAWRARAFILAMTGDVPGANTIATGMMPPGMAQGLQPFFARLATLSAIDRAFAVHFGEVRPTPERLADARLVPALPLLGPDPYAIAPTAAVRPPQVRVPEPSRRERRRREREERAELARAGTQRARTLASAAATPPSPRPVAPPATAVASRPIPTPVPPPTPRPPASVASQAVARAPLAPSAQTASAQRPVPQPGFGDGVQKTTLSDTLRAARFRQPAAARPVPNPPIETGPIEVAAAQAPAPAAAPAGAVASPPAPDPLAPAQEKSEAPVQLAAVQPRPVSGIVGTAVQPGFGAGEARGQEAASLGQVGALARASAPNPPVATATAQSAALSPGSPTSSAPSLAAPGSLASALPPTVAEAVPGPVPAPAAITSAAPAAVASNTPVAPRMSEDSILTRIVAGIAIPGSELGVGSPPLPPPAPVPASPSPPPSPLPTPSPAVTMPPARVEVAQVPVAPAPAPRRATSAPAKEAPAPKPKPRVRTAQVEQAEPSAPRTGKRDAKVKTTDKRKEVAAAENEESTSARKGRRGTDVAKAGAKSKPDKAEAADKKSRAAKPGAKEESRIWVQVAGGAQEGDLPKAWSAVKAKAPALAKRDGYATPLRATNRVVTGPFKSEAEAQALVNQLTKQGVSAFTFKSNAGQKVTRLPGK